METLVIRKPDDMHVHLREGEMLCQVLPSTARYCSRAIVMPNTKKPLTDYQKVIEYFKEIEALAKITHLNFKPLRTLYLTDNTSLLDIVYAKTNGVVAAKLYPKGATTGAGNGVSDVKKLSAVFSEMQNCNMVLSIHGEMPDTESKDAELDYFIGPFGWIYRTFPKLKIVWEHITTKEVLNLLKRYPERVAGTITTHHLFLSQDDVLCNSYNYCRPPAKQEKDQVALIEAAISGNPKFFFGSDSAPHYKIKKDSVHNAPAGVFSAPVAIEALAQLFEQMDALDKLEAYTSQFGAEFYGLPLNQERLCLMQKQWEVPIVYGSCHSNAIVPFMAGKKLRWKLVL